MRTLWVRVQGAELALDQHGLVLQQRVHEAPRGQLRQQVREQLHPPLAVQQRLLVQRLLGAPHLLVI